MVAAFSLSWHRDDIALLTLDVPNSETNTLSLAALEELDDHLRSLSEHDEVAGLIIRSGKSGSFASGLRMLELLALLEAPEEALHYFRRGQQILLQLSKQPFVTVAAIEGLCLGGGAEMAAWCDRRLFAEHPNTKFGFPEVKLGLLPCCGGTVRAPRVVGFTGAMEMICTGKLLDPQTAMQMGWATAIVRADQLLDAAMDLVREEQRTRSYAIDSDRWSQPLALSFERPIVPPPTENIPAGTERHYPAPAAILELISISCGLPEEEALQCETRTIMHLFGSPVNRALINVFSLIDRASLNHNDNRTTISPRAVQPLGIIGAGIMGSGIATLAVESGLKVLLSDSVPEALEKGQRQIVEELSRDPQTGELDANRALKYTPLLKLSHRDEDFSETNLVLEAVIESITVKCSLFGQLERQMRPDAILASNTSTIPITRLAQELTRPERFCGIHFFNPVRVAKLVEIIRGAKTNDETVATAVEFAKRVGRTPVVVNDGPGFLVNRLLFPYLNEAIELMIDGASLHEIDQAAIDFGMPLGPFAVFDLIGIDTAFYAGRNFWLAFPERVSLSPVLPTLVKAGRLGQKSGRGFYSYENPKRQAEDDPAFLPLIDRFRRGSRKPTSEEITHRLLLVMLQEATRLLDDNIVHDVRDIDLGLVLGVGFPPFRGGLLYWADSVGLPTILQWLQPLTPLGRQMEPTPRLLRMARDNEKFYAATYNAVLL